MTMTLLNKNAVATRLGVKPRTAAALMLEMNPVIISGTVRKQYRVTEENLEQWIAKRTMGKPTTSSIGKGCKRKLERR